MAKVGDDRLGAGHRVLEHLGKTHDRPLPLVGKSPAVENVEVVAHDLARNRVPVALAGRWRVVEMEVDNLYNAKDNAHREFCEIFGPEYILSNVGEFIDYFMVRKVIAGKDLMRAAGTVTKKLARWLGEKGYVEPAAARVASSRSTSQTWAPP